MKFLLSIEGDCPETKGDADGSREAVQDLVERFKVDLGARGFVARDVDLDTWDEHEDEPLEELLPTVIGEEE